MLRFCVPGATYGCRASIVPLYKDAAIVEHSDARVLQEYAFLENLDGECINGRKTVGVGAISGDGGPSGGLSRVGAEVEGDTGLRLGSFLG